MREKILLVEDEPALLETIKEYLEPRYYVVTARNAAQASEALDTVDFKAIIVDLGLPDISGLAVIKKARKINKRLAIIALTGDQTLETVQHAMELDIDDYLVKPVDAEQLHDRIKKAVRHRYVVI
tara:strand:- start:86534 stop:86908 length:375 start_codon:yes stop_codon:yes gene_type:complete